MKNNMAKNSKVINEFLILQGPKKDPTQIKPRTFLSPSLSSFLNFLLNYTNRWSKIAKYLPGRTDNEIKNYWRTRVQKHAKQLQCDVNSKKFKDAMRYVWIPRLIERIRAASGSTSFVAPGVTDLPVTCPEISDASGSQPDSSGTSLSSPPVAEFSESFDNWHSTLVQGGEFKEGDGIHETQNDNEWVESMMIGPGGYGKQEVFEFEESGWEGGFSDNLWSLEDILFMHQ